MKKCFAILWMLIMATCFFSWIEYSQQHTPISIPVAAGWPQPVYDTLNNPLSKEGFELGKRLFYDGILSKDGNFPCASCHQQFGAFDNYEHVLSHGYNYQQTLRNAPPLQNLAWQSNFMWDGSINSLDKQPLFPINAHNEMAESTDNVIKKLNADTAYPNLFNQVFGKGPIDSIKLGKALSQFMAMLVSNNSKYDKVMRKEAAFTPSEAVGYKIFLEKCNACHKEPLFTDYSFRNTGLLPEYSLQDFGRMRQTGKEEDFMKFRVPSLRNVQVTFPYGHDGRFTKLYNAIDHYSNGLEAFPNTDSLVRNRINLTSADIGRLTAFLNTLTDTSFLVNPKFAPNGYVISPSLMHTHN